MDSSRLSGSLLAVSLVFFSIFKGLTGALDCDGCADPTQDCYFFDNSTDKYLGCYGNFTDGLTNIQSVCGPGYVAPNVSYAVTLGFTTAMCDDVSRTNIFFFAESGHGQLCNSMYDGGTSGLWGCSGDNTNGDTDYFDPACDRSGVTSCLSITNLVCDGASDLIINNSTVITDADNYITLNFLDPTYGGVICIREPTMAPTSIPSYNPSVMPSNNPSSDPTSVPSRIPTSIPSHIPSTDPTSVPSHNPSIDPTSVPTYAPTIPTIVPSTLPSNNPSHIPSSNPSSQPTKVPTVAPTDPTPSPTDVPSLSPSDQPTDEPSISPTTSSSSSSNSTVFELARDFLIYTIIILIALVLCCILCLVLCCRRRNNKMEEEVEDANTLHGTKMKPKTLKTVSPSNEAATPDAGTRTPISPDSGDAAISDGATSDGDATGATNTGAGDGTAGV